MRSHSVRFVRRLVAVFALALSLGVSDARGQACPLRCSLGPTSVGRLCANDLECNDVQGSFCDVAAECVHLEFRPQTVGVGSVGAQVDIPLYAVSSTGFNRQISSVIALLEWDPARLELLGNTDPCDNGSPCFVCPANQYNWQASGFFNDCAADALNFPCTGLPANDGNARYSNLVQLLCNNEPAPQPFATASGLHVTTFHFRVLIDDGQPSYVSMYDEFGELSATQVLAPAGGGSGSNIIGDLPVPAEVTISECEPPTVRRVGSRMIEVTPAPGAQDVAIRLSGHPSEPTVACMTRYASSAALTFGKLRATPVFRSPDFWGTVLLRGAEIRPETEYQVYSVCGDLNSSVLSAPVDVLTFVGGDTNDDARCVGGPNNANVCIRQEDCAGAPCKNDFLDVLNVVDFILGTPLSGVPCVSDANCADVDGIPPNSACDLQAGFCIKAYPPGSNVANPGGTLPSGQVLDPCIPDLRGDYPDLYSTRLRDPQIDISDVLGVIDRFLGLPLNCPVPCP